MIDTHAHVQDKVFDSDRGQVLQRAFQAGVEAMIIVGYNYSTSEAGVALCTGQAALYAAVGVHPHDAQSWDKTTLSKMQKLAESREVIAIGETGLDFFRNISPKKKQQEVFREQLQLAVSLHLPVIIHSREATEEVLAIVADYPGLRGVIHCYSGTTAQAEKFIQAGYYIGVCGNVTYPQATTLKEVARKIPLEYVLLETDAPYLAPQEYRGKRNEPSFLPCTAREIASLRNVDAGAVIKQTTENAKKLFKLEKKF